MIEYLDIEEINRREKVREEKEAKKKKELNPLLHVLILLEQYFNSL